MHSDRQGLLMRMDDLENHRSNIEMKGYDLVGSSPSSSSHTPKINHEKEIYPYCIVWTPLPMISWFLPFIGHTGIADSRGVIYDFAGPYHIGVGHLSFSKPTKFLPLDPSKCTASSWDEGVRQGCDVYRQRMHNICFDNCHSHVAKCLNVMGYNRASDYGMIRIGVWMFFRGRWVSFPAFVRTYLPFAIIATIIALLSSGTFW